MTRKLTAVSLVVGLCLMGVMPGLAQKVYPTLAEYEKLTGKEIEKFSEAPMLRIKVVAGEIPPVEERLPQEPMVVEPLEEIGEYGGTLKAPAMGPRAQRSNVASARHQHLFRVTPDLKTVVPNIAKGWDLSGDYKTLTVYLRKGMKWSDGAPFTADDIMFWYEDIILNDNLTPVKPDMWSSGGKLVKVEKINDYTVRFQFAEPYPPIVRMLSQGWDPYAPKHYLKKYHIKYNPKANEIAKKEDYDYWWMCFKFHNDSAQLNDFDLPVLTPWTSKKMDSYGNVYFERNPYYWKIDTAGNQLPYVDEQAAILVENPEVMNLKAIAGEFDYVSFQLKLANYPLYKGGEEKGNYHTMLWKGLRGAEVQYVFNLTNKDPVLRKIVNDIRFRQAMSLAMNREEVSQILFFGKAAPRQSTVMPDCSFYEPWMGKYYVEHDPKRANKLLDEMGLKWDRNHEYRLRPDGKILAVTLDYTPISAEASRCSELVKDYWGKVGVKVALKQDTRELFMKRGLANELDVSSRSLGWATEFHMYFHPSMFRCPWSPIGNPASGIGWWYWYESKGKTGEEPPKVVKRLFKVVEEWRRTLPGTEEYLKLGKEILTIDVKNLFAISAVGIAPYPVIIKNYLRNTPKEGAAGPDYGWWAPYQADQWFFEK